MQQCWFARSVRNVIKESPQVSYVYARVARNARAPARDCVGIKRIETRREKDDCALLGAMNARETHVNPGRSFRECVQARTFISQVDVGHEK